MNNKAENIYYLPSVHRGRVPVKGRVCVCVCVLDEGVYRNAWEMVNMSGQKT